MQNRQAQVVEQPTRLIQQALTGLAEIDGCGNILHINAKGKALLLPIWAGHGVCENNLFPLLDHIAPSVSRKIQEACPEAGYILENELYSFSFFSGEKNTDRHFSFMAFKMFTGNTLVGFEDIEDSYNKEEALHQAILDKAVVQGKFEIASNVLHDIGNAVVGFSSYLTRIKRSMELDNSENLENLVGFFETHKNSMSDAIGAPKADAVIKILSGIVQTQKGNYTDICKSIKEQQNIIVHIQEILNIQRQYMNGNGANERKPIHMASIISDCMSMIFASLNKRNITATLDIPDELPVIRGDRTKLMQVMLNILKNSVEAIDVYAVEKSISLTITATDALLVLHIKDSGKGFDEETAKQLFTRGFTTKSSGTGLGLHNCRAIIESYDGTMSISSAGQGKGALTTLQFKI